MSEGSIGRGEGAGEKRRRMVNIMAITYARYLPPT